MSKAIITIEDSSETGVHISIVFEPALKNDDSAVMTPAQNAAVIMLEALKSSDNVDEIGEEAIEFED